MRILLALSLLAAVAVAPTAAAGCIATIAGICVSDPCDGPFSCRAACTATVDACVDPEACIAGDARGCVDVTTDCLHTTCGPPL